MAVPYAPRDYYRPQGVERLIDLVSRRGDIAAQGAMNSGKIWSGAVNSLGDIASQYFKDREEKPLRDAKLASLQSENQLRGLQIQSATRGAEREAKTQSVLDKGGVFPEVFASLQSDPEAQKRYAEAHNAFKSSIDDAKGSVALSLLDAGKTPQAIEIAKRTLIEEGFDRAMVEQVSSDPQALDAILNQWVTNSPKHRTILESRQAKELERTSRETTASNALEERKLARESRDELAKEALTLRGELGRGLLDVRRDVADAKKQQADAEVENAASQLLNGNTAQKIPARVAPAAIAEARKRGGLDGTGFVPENDKQLAKYLDLNDLKRKATRLQSLLDDPEVVSKLGPWTGAVVDWSKESGLIGQSTIVKEAFDLMKDLSDTELRRRSQSQTSEKESDRIIGFTISPKKLADSNKTNIKNMLTSINRVLRGIGAVNPDSAAPGARPSLESFEKP